jgi:hypothetical protein
MPLPGLLYAQVVKRMKRRRIVEVIHRVVIGTQAKVDAVLAPCGWQINTAIVEYHHRLENGSGPYLVRRVELILVDSN